MENNLLKKQKEILDIGNRIQIYKEIVGKSLEK
jgi:hypothetical protein